MNYQPNSRRPGRNINRFGCFSYTREKSRGERRLGGRSAYSLAMALVWTGKDYGVLKCHLDPAYLDCSIVCGGGIKERAVRAALEKLEKSKASSFKAFLAAFETALDRMMKCRSWADEWSYPPLEDEEDEDRIDDYYQDEEILESYFRALDEPDLGSWRFGK